MRFKERLKQISYPYAAVLLFLIAGPLIAVTEFPYVASEDLAPWAALKIFGFLIAVPAFIKTRRGHATDLAIGTFFFACCFHTFTSGLYRPMYESGYFQAAICCAFVPTRNKWIYPTIFLIGAAFMSLLEPAREFFGITMAPATDISVFVSVFIFFVISLIVYSVVANFRAERSAQTMRLSMLGKNSTMIAHDIKGLLSGPLLHVTAIHDRTDEVSQTDMHNAILYLKEDLTNASRVLQKMSEMSRVEEQIREVPLTKIVDAVAVLLQRRLTGVELTVDVNGIVRTSPTRFRFVLMNVLFNSTEQFSRHMMRLREAAPARSATLRVPFTPKIRITNSKNALVIEDNAGGMNAEIMRSLKNGKFVSAKGDEGGLGFQIITNETRDLDLSFSFVNTEALGSPGFRIEISGLAFVPAT